MKVDFLNEPELEFGGGGTHVDVRFGIMQHGPLDRGSAVAPSQLKVGIIGTEETVEGVQLWLERCRSGIPAKETRLTNLFPSFPGFSEDSCFSASLVLHDRWLAPIHRNEIESVLAETGPENAVFAAVELFVEYAKQVIDPGGAMVLICAPPQELLAGLESNLQELGDSPDQEIDEGTDPPSSPYTKRHVQQFHDLLKAHGMSLGVPIQMIRPGTFGGQKERRRGTRRHPPRPLQDEATRAWNFHTALYYKAGGIPWRLLRRPAELTTCFIGVSFYRTVEGDRVLTSIAQVFNERGEGVIVKGEPAQQDKDDRQPHLSGEDARALLLKAIHEYRREHKTSPARIVVHKTSKTTLEELHGFRAAADEERIDTLDLLSVRRSFTRLFRDGIYPPLRGTLLELDEETHLLYLRGSVNFFEAYPGLYVPRPFEFSIEHANTTSRRLAEEILALSKLNWNNTQFDGGEPMTVRAARRVGDILKCVPDDGKIQSSFRFYM